MYFLRFFLFFLFLPFLRFEEKNPTLQKLNYAYSDFSTSTFMMANKDRESKSCFVFSFCLNWFIKTKMGKNILITTINH